MSAEKRAEATPPHKGSVDVHSHYLPSALAGALARRSELPRISEGSGGRRLIEYGTGNVRDAS